MPRYIPPAFQEHLDTGMTALALCIRIDPVTPGFASYGITGLDRNIVYDGVIDEMTYLAAIGMQPSNVMFTADLAVDNAEFPHLLPEFDIPISEVDIRAGAYDFSRFTLFLVIYDDLAAGHVILQEGTIGKIPIRADGLSFVNEYRGLSAELKQSVCEKDSLTCRAIFGSQPAGSLIPGPIQRFPCGFDATSLLVAGTVSAVSLEPTITFTVSPFTMDEDELNPGIALFLTGLNAGRTFEISSNTSGGEISLAHDTPFPVQIGDELQYRRDCSKIARDTEKGCMSHFGGDWVLHFRGEPDIPIGDAGAMETPGASGSPGRGGPTSVPIAEE